MTRTETLERALTIVNDKKREAVSGKPEESFEDIAALWNAYMLGKGSRSARLFKPTDVAIMMALLKIARIKGGIATEDSFVDLAGYAACGAELSMEDSDE